MKAFHGLIIWYLSHGMLKPTKWECAEQTQIVIGICPVWSVFGFLLSGYL